MQTNEDLKALESGLDALQSHSDEKSRGPLWARVLPPITGLLLVWAVWQWAFSQHFVPDWKLPSPSQVWNAIHYQYEQGTITVAVFNSLRRAVIGFFLAVLIGTPLGILVARVKVIRTTLGPVLSGLQQLPSVAWVPAAVIWFGLTNKTIFMVVLLGAVPSIANGLVSAIDQIPPLYLRAGQVMGARGFATVRFILLPAALPGFISGLEQGWAFAWRSLMAAELIAISPQLGAGLGQLLETGRQLGDMPLVIGSIILVLITGICVERIGFAPLRRRILSNRGLVSSR